jgi:hypothetical protein
VQAFLGQLEGDGYLADRLELRQLHHLFSTSITADGVWIYFAPESAESHCLAAWWRDGTLQNLQLIHLPPKAEDRDRGLVDELAKMAWAGEIEGWWSTPTSAHLIAEPDVSDRWEPVLRDWTGGPVTKREPLAKGALAEAAARRIARNESRADLLPSEFSVTYRQRLIDRLWMGGLGAMVMVYTVGVLIYFAALQVMEFRKTGLEKEVAGLSQSYTNALELNERVGILQEQLNLKFAALDCWRVASEALPGELTLDWISFKGGTVLNLQGTGPVDQSQPVIDYNKRLLNATLDGERVFQSVAPPTFSNRGGTLAWSFACQLASGRNP